MKWLAILVLWSATAAAQTGGRMGGASWSSRPSRPSDSSSRTYTPSPTVTEPSSFTPHDTPTYTPPTTYTPPPSYDHMLPPPSTGSGAYAGSRPLTSGPYMDDHRFDHAAPGIDVPWLFFGGVVLVLVFAALRPLLFPDKLAKVARQLANEEVDVSVLRVALDGRVRRFVQLELARIAKVADTRTQEGRVAMLREVALMLRRLREAWIYAGAINAPMGPIGVERTVFEHHVDDARARFREETISNVDGRQSGIAPSHYVARSDEGLGVILVSIVLAARRELYTVASVDSGENLRTALEAAATLDPETLVAVEIIWQPSEDADRLTSIEVEAKYPPPELIRLRGALVGKAFCGHCGGPYPAELVACPHCGAPARDGARAA